MTADLQQDAVPLSDRPWSRDPIAVAVATPAYQAAREDLQTAREIRSVLELRAEDG